MNKQQRYSATTALIVALGGFLMGFDASVISGVVKFIEPEFNLTKIQLGWSVASLALTASLAMMVAGPLSDKLGRIPVLKIAALLFAVSALASALAQSFTVLVLARMLGGLGVGTALIIAPMYIAEMAPAAHRGRLVSFNQLNIVLGISAAFFTNYLIITLAKSDAAWVSLLKIDHWNWRWMLGLETLPAILYFFCLYRITESPRWLIMQGRHNEARIIMEKIHGEADAKTSIAEINASLKTEDSKAPLKELIQKPLRLALAIGITVAVLQQITGINAVFFYAPMIFEQSGVGTDAAFMQAVLVGVINVVFTLLAMAIIDKVGRRPLLSVGVMGIAGFMILLAYGFSAATYTITPADIAALPASVDKTQLIALQNMTFNSDIAFKQALAQASVSGSVAADLLVAAITINPAIILIGILGFVACFAMSLGPVMWVLFSELFPNRLRGVAISFVGLINSGVSFLVQLLFPWQLANLGNSMTFLLYGLVALLGWVLIVNLLPETKGRSLENLEGLLSRS